MGGGGGFYSLDARVGGEDEGERLAEGWADKRVGLGRSSGEKVR